MVKKFKEPVKTSADWLTNIDKAQSDYQTYSKKCDKIKKRYLFEESSNTSQRKFQLLWSCMEVIKPSVYARCPVPFVSPRFKDEGNDVQRKLSELVERTVIVQSDLCHLDDTMKTVRDDYLLYARGWARVKYEAEFETLEKNPYEDDVDIEAQEDETEDAIANEKLVSEKVAVEFVNRKDLIMPKARTWDELPWIAIRSFLSRSALRKRWPDIADDIVFSKPKARDDSERSDSAQEQATIYEIWDKDNRKVMWVSPGYDDFLEGPIEPYLHFENFWPGPKPCFGTISSESLIPVQDFVFWQDQADEVNQLTARISSLTESLKLVGFYPGGPEGEGAPEIEKAVRPGFENRMVAVRSWDVFTQGGKGGSPIVWLPIEQVATIIKECISIRQQIIQDVYQITGISDIMRGNTEAEETAAAQGLKSQWGSLRLKTKQDELARFARDLFRMMTECIAENFSMKTMMECSMITLPTDQDIQMMAQEMQKKQAMAAQMAQQQAAQHPPGPPQGQPSQGMPHPQMPPQGMPQAHPAAIPPQGAPSPMPQGMPPQQPPMAPSQGQPMQGIPQPNPMNQSQPNPIRPQMPINPQQQQLPNQLQSMH